MKNVIRLKSEGKIERKKNGALKIDDSVKKVRRLQKFEQVCYYLLFQFHKN